MHSSPVPGSVQTAGRVREGVRPSCLLLGPWLLVGDLVRDVRPGESVRVTGTPQPNLMTTCQQGTPLAVTFLERLAGGPSVPPTAR